MENEFEYIGQDHEEWNPAWAGLVKELREKHFCVSDMADEYQGETWQHMGKYNGHHEFRHRAFPGRGGARLYVKVKI